MTDAALDPAPHERAPDTFWGRPLSPLTARRLAAFKKNRRGVWSLRLFLVLFVVSLFAEVIANDKPILIATDDGLYFPIVVEYAETEFGGDFETEADYRDPFVQDLIVENGGWMVWPLIEYSYRTINYDLPTPAPSPPTWDNWLGTDDQGRDVMARLIYGFRLSVVFALLLTVCSTAIGVAAGAVQGYFGGWTDLLMQRFIEIWQGMPTLYVLIILSSVLVPGFAVLLGIMVLFGWTALVEVVRTEFLRARNLDYVKAARAMGVSDRKIMMRHVLPNAMVSALTFLPFLLGGGITSLTALDFLGLGLPPGSPSLGELLAQGKANLQAPWLGISGFIVLSVMLSLLVFIGEAVRDAFDPRRGAA